jgi:2,3-bisphosphoglycerate-independent phosphoglycerate mutase
VSTALSINGQGLKRSGFDIETIKKEKAAFLIKELNLTDAESKAFIPLESEFMSRKFEVNRDARRETRVLKEKPNKIEEDYQRIIKLNLESEKREAELQIEYYKKFGEVLSARKVEKYRAADMKFKEYMLQKIEERRKANPQRNRHGK